MKPHAQPHLFSTGHNDSVPCTSLTARFMANETARRHEMNADIAALKIATAVCIMVGAIASVVATITAWM